MEMYVLCKFIILVICSYTFNDLLHYLSTQNIYLFLSFVCICQCNLQQSFSNSISSISNKSIQHNNNNNNKVSMNMKTMRNRQRQQTSPSSHSLRVLLLVCLQLHLIFIPQQDSTALAFALHSSSIGSRSSSSTSSTSGGNTFLQKTRSNIRRRQPPFLLDGMHSSSLRVRGGGGGGITKLHENNNFQGDNEKSHKIASEALQSIRYCCKMCFASVIADVLITLITRDFWSRLLSATLTWIDYIAIFDTTSLLVFGVGLWKISQLYFGSISDMTKRMEKDHLLDLFRNMKQIWGLTALNLALVAVSIGATLPAMMKDNDGPFKFMLDGVSSRHLIAGVVGVLAVVRLVIRDTCAKTATREKNAYDEEMANIGQQEFQPSPKHAMLREAGYRAYVNQAQCAGSFGVMTFLELVKWIVSIEVGVGGLIGHLFSVSDVLTPFAITVLLFALNKALLRAAIAEVRGGPKGIEQDDETYNDMFVAQVGFYKKVGDTLKTA